MNSDNSTITPQCDDYNARVAAAEEANRLQEKVRRLEAQGRWSEAEALAIAWEDADRGSDTWGETSLKLVEL
jgi:hypothetical protein